MRHYCKSNQKKTKRLPVHTHKLIIHDHTYSCTAAAVQHTYLLSKYKHTHSTHAAPPPPPPPPPPPAPPLKSFVLHAPGPGTSLARMIFHSTSLFGRASLNRPPPAPGSFGAG